jgi:hypothetical protein
MNSNIANRTVSTGQNGESKKHQAFNMELSRLKAAKETCLVGKNCSEFIQLGGDERLRQIEPVVEVPKKTDEYRRKVQKDTNPQNSFQKEKSPTELTKPTNDSHESNILRPEQLSEALQKEISNIRYLMVYMDNNNKKII